MKWSLIGLLFLGLVAAGCVTAMVLSMQASAHAQTVAEAPVTPVAVVEEPAEPSDPEVRILTAAADLDTRHMLGAEDITVETVKLSALPEGACTEPIEAIGKVLLIPMKQGQALLRRCFAAEGSGVHLASTLGAGKRAVSVTLSDEMGMETLLDPGCVVDVMATMKARDEISGEAMPISVTLLERVRVLAVGDRTIFSEDDGTTTETGPLGNDRPPVTLLLSPAEAEKLKLAMEEGSVSLSLRDPMDATSGSGAGTMLLQLSPILEEAARREREKWLEEQRLAREQLELERQRLEKDKQAVEKAATEIEQTTPVWETTILRGGNAETKQFMQEANAPSGARKAVRNNK